jgi:acyl dehydratase
MIIGDRTSPIAGATRWRPLDPAQLLSVEVPSRTVAYTERDTMLYALSVGFGTDSLNARELRYVFEEPELQVVPTMACVLARHDLYRQAGVDHARLLHAQQSVRFHAAFPPAGELLVEAAITAVYDQSEGRGAFIEARVLLRDACDGREFAELRSLVYARGGGGFGGERPPPAIAPVPGCPPHKTVVQRIPENLALVYRLNGDRNPLHADPSVAARAGFSRPILHGLCTYGMACRAVLASYADYQPERLHHMDGRFVAPLFPGETLKIDLWEVDSSIRIRCTGAERGVVVLDGSACATGCAQVP